MDGLDALLAEAASAREQQQHHSQKRAVEPPNPPPRPTHQLPLLAPPTPAVKAELHRLKTYIQLLLDPAVLDTISRELDARSFADVEAYCASNPQLARYTMEHELRRMRYHVTTPSGGAFSDPSAIRELYFQREPTDGERLLWAMSNQSLFADLIGAVQPHWMDPDLSISVRASHSSFAIDLRPENLTLEASCTLSICTLGAGDQPLELGVSTAAINVDLQRKSLRQSLEKPRLRECVIYEEQLLGVASSLVETAASLSMNSPPCASCGNSAVEGSSVDEMARQFEAFMTNDDSEMDRCAPSSSQAEIGNASGGMLSSLWGSLVSSRPSQSLN
ncbi:hypothetical protein AB1Y20_006789 [Prymnesium parvum]|uniref:Uncharacterized protein n=1 Tax=Prymnesium parvum TaxID=97485 RepID=A0AB34IZD6_PRYPA